MKNMSLGFYKVIFTVLIFFLSLTLSCSLRATPDQYMSAGTQGETITQRDEKKGDKEIGMELEIFPAGSSLPDCSHACGPCFPCKRVIVSFKCSTAEPCPIVYRCMCKGKYYHVPSIEGHV